jgi:hypothetical protein
MSDYSADRALPGAAIRAGRKATGRSRLLRRGGLGGVAVLACAAVCGAAATGAFAAPAQTMPAADLTAYLGLPVPVFAAPFVEPGTFPNVKVTGNCSAAPWLFTDTVGLDFQSGNAVVYRGQSGDVFPFLPGGLNAEGVATLDDFTTGMPTGFVGRTHAWLGQNANANGQFYAGETVTFSGTAPDGSTISFTANPGEIHSAAGHQGGWGEQNLSCNIVS